MNQLAVLLLSVIFLFLCSAPQGLGKPTVEGLNSSAIEITWLPPGFVNGPAPLYKVERTSTALNYPSPVARGTRFPGEGFYRFPPDTIPQNVGFTGELYGKSTQYQSWEQFEPKWKESIKIIFSYCPFESSSTSTSLTVIYAHLLMCFRYPVLFPHLCKERSAILCCLWRSAGRVHSHTVCGWTTSLCFWSSRLVLSRSKSHLLSYMCQICW